MVKVEAVVIRERVETVIDAVEDQTGHVGVTVVEAIGHGRQRGITHEYRGRVFESRFLPKAVLTFVVTDEIAEDVVAAIVDCGAKRERVGRRDRLDDPGRRRHTQPHRQSTGGGGDRMTTKDLAIATSTVWVILAAILVMFMQAGFAFLEAGLTRMKNVGHIAAKNVLIFALASIVYFAVGYGIAFGDGGNGLVGGSGFMPSIDELLTVGEAPFSWFSSIPAAAGYMFEVVFCAVSLAIVWGAMAERTRLWVYFAFGAIFTLIYSVVSHWIWSPDGWLFNQGMQDFAGSTVVHYQGALAALAGALLLGPRIGKFGADGKPNAIPGHNMAFVTLGVIILWFGWFGFNPGSTLERRLRRSRLLRIRRAQHESRGCRRRPRRGPDVVDRDQEARPLDDAERRRRRARRDHGRLCVRRAVGGDADRVRGGSDRRPRRPPRRARPDRRSDRRDLGARHGRNLGHALAGLPRPTVAGQEPRHRERGSLLRRRPPSARRAGPRPCGRRRVHVHRVASRVLWLMKVTVGIRTDAEAETAGLDVSEHGMWGYPEFYIPVPGGYGTESHGHLGISHAARPAAATAHAAVVVSEPLQ